MTGNVVYDHAGVRILCGDSRRVLRDIPDASIDCCITSPPYWGLRDYGVDGQIGLEHTHELFVAEMLELFREVRRILLPRGTLWLNLGDSYAGTAGGYQGKNGDRASRTFTARIGTTKQGPGLKPKDMCGIPWRVALALQADGWWLRSDIIWAKPNTMPESIRDRPTKSHEYVFLFAKSEMYHYDADAIKEPVAGTAHPRGRGLNPKSSSADQVKVRGNERYARAIRNTVERRNKRTVWTIAPEPFAGGHFATFPTALVRPMILAGCPAGGTVLDPFAGAGTTLLVAKELGRSAIGIELNAEYCAMAVDRVKQDVLPLTQRRKRGA